MKMKNKFFYNGAMTDTHDKASEVKIILNNHLYISGIW